MSGQEKRRYKRYSCNFPIQLYVVGHTKPVEAEIMNISLGGAFVAAKSQIPQGQKVLLEFKDAEVEMIHARIAGEKPISRPDNKLPESSIVRWVQRVSGTGIGVEFVNVRPETQKFLQDLIQFLSDQESRQGTPSDAENP